MSTDYKTRIAELEARMKAANQAGDSAAQEAAGKEFKDIMYHVADQIGLDRPTINRAVIVEETSFSRDIARGLAAAAYCGWKDCVQLGLDMSERMTTYAAALSQMNSAFGFNFFNTPICTTDRDPEGVARFNAAIRVELEKAEQAGIANRKSVHGQSLKESVAAEGIYNGTTAPELLTCYCVNKNDLLRGLGAMLSFGVKTGDEAFYEHAEQLMRQLFQIAKDMDQLNIVGGLGVRLLEDDFVNDMSNELARGRVAVEEVKEKIAA